MVFNPIEEIKQRIDIVDFISSYIPLKKAGANFKALCPFHTEKTPSFMVSRSKQIWHCFGCNTGGDIFSFLMKIEGIDFGDALKILAEKAGVKLEKTDPRLSTLRNRILDILETAKDFYHELLNKPEGSIAKNYLLKRGLDEETIKKFELGYAPNAWDSLVKKLSSQFSLNDLSAAGLVVKNPEKKSFYDRFRHRVMFPIRDVYGNTVGFTGRILDEKQSGGKYINTPETIVYNKGKILYGLDLAKEEIKAKDLAILVEGNMDVITSFQFGFKNTVAASGTALTLDQLKLLKRFTSNIALAFDADLAGQEALKRGIHLALAQEMNIKVIEIPQKVKDPDEAIRLDPQAWAQAITQALDFFEWYFKKSLQLFDLTKPLGKKRCFHFLAEELKYLPSSIEQNFWLEKISQALGVDLAVLKDEYKKFLRKEKKENFTLESNLKETVVNKQKNLEDRLMIILSFAPEFLPRVVDKVFASVFVDPLNKELYLNMLEYYNRNKNINKKDWQRWVKENNPRLLENLNIKELAGESEFESWTQENLVKELNSLVSRLRQEQLKILKENLIEELKQAEAIGDKEKIFELSRRFEEIISQDKI